MNTTTTPTFAGKTAEQWRDEERRCLQDREDSWERSDTDGFLSQWASQQMAARYRHLADVADDGGLLTLTAYVDVATGEVIKGRWVDVRHGSAWAPFDRDRGLIFPSGARTPAVRERNNLAKGLREVTVQVPALLNRRTMEAYPDRDAAWLVVDDA